MIKKIFMLSLTFSYAFIATCNATSNESTTLRREAHEFERIIELLEENVIITQDAPSILAEIVNLKSMNYETAKVLFSNALSPKIQCFFEGNQSLPISESFIKGYIRGTVDRFLNEHYPNQNPWLN